MSEQNNQLSFMDLLEIISFVIGIANYSENLGQTQFQESLNKAVKDVHDHLKDQDEKLTLLLEMLDQKGSELQ